MQDLYNSPARMVLYRQIVKSITEGLDTYWIGEPVRTGVGAELYAGFRWWRRTISLLENLSYNCVAGAMKGSFSE